jgi:hypothetical protein
MFMFLISRATSSSHLYLGFLSPPFPSPCQGKINKMFFSVVETFCANLYTKLFFKISGYRVYFPVEFSWDLPRHPAILPAVG